MTAEKQTMNCLEFMNSIAPANTLPQYPIGGTSCPLSNALVSKVKPTGQVLSLTLTYALATRSHVVEPD